MRKSKMTGHQAIKKKAVEAYSSKFDQIMIRNQTGNHPGRSRIKPEVHQQSDLSVGDTCMARLVERLVSAGFRRNNPKRVL